MNISTADIYEALIFFYSPEKGFRYQIDNVFIYSWESDFFCVTRSGYGIEVEVKSSRSDFLADFKKTDKHEKLSNPGPRIVDRIDWWHVSEDFEYDYNKALNEIEKGFRRNLSCKVIWVNPEDVPNRFFYAAPMNMLKPEEIPPYAGLIEIELVNGRLKAHKSKEAPLLHKSKPDVGKLLIDRYYWKHVNKWLGNVRKRRELRFQEINRRTL